MRTIVVGDVHGCADELAELLRLLEHESRDRLVFVGDLVAKGPASRDVVAMARDAAALGVRGNHDERCLGWWEATQRGDEPPSLGPAHLPVCESLDEADWRWLAALPYYQRLPEVGALVVHAGLVPDVPLEEQEPRNLVRMRSIRDDGTPSPRIEEGQPWASLWPGPELVLFGHDAVRGLQRWRHAIGLDTGCVYGGRLTAYILPERRMVSVPAKRAYAPKGGAP